MRGGHNNMEGNDDQSKEEVIQMELLSTVRDVEFETMLDANVGES